MSWRKKSVPFLIGMLILEISLVGAAFIPNINNIFRYAAGLHDPAGSTATITPIRDNIFLIQGGRANITVLVGNEGMLIVDTGVRRMQPDIHKALAELSDKPVLFVINTHAHHDHRKGSAYYQAKGAQIIAHAATRDNIAIENSFFYDGPDDYSPADDPEIPTTTFINEHSFVFAGEEIRLSHIPNAHTKGDAIVRFVSANVLATGDIFVHRNSPFISNTAGATVAGYIAGQEALLSYSDEKTVLVPGHGPLATQTDLTAATESLRLLSRRLSKQYAPGDATLNDRLAAQSDH